MTLPKEWEPCAGIEGVEIKLCGGSLLFRETDSNKIIGEWVRPPSVHSTTAVRVIGERGVTSRLGNARTFPQARDKVRRHLEAQP